MLNRHASVRHATHAAYSRGEALRIIALTAVASSMVARFGVIGLVATLPIVVVVIAVARSAWAPLCYFLFSLSVWHLVLGPRSSDALYAALVALPVWALGRSHVDGMWRALWGGACTPSNTDPGGGRATAV